jgi:WD40 repeat protein
MNDLLRDKLCELLAAHGRPLIEDRPRCEALLWLAAGENSRGMFALTGALERKVPQAILTAPPERRDADLLEKLTRRLMADLDMDEAAARWAVESWASAVAAAPAQPLVLPEPRPPEATPPAPAWQPLRPVPAAASEFAALPSLTLDDEPAPARPAPAPAPLNLDKFFTGRTPEDVFLRGGTEGVSCLAYSCDGLTLATGHDDGTVRLWDADTGRQRAILTGHAARVRALAFAPHGRQLASGDAAGDIKLWHLPANRQQTTLDGHEGSVTCLAYSPDGATLVSGGADRLVRLWYAEGGTFRRALEGHTDEVTSLAYCPDGRTVASASLDDTVRLWDVGFGSYWATLQGHAGGVTALAYSPYGESLVTGGRDGTVRLWHAETAREVATSVGARQGHPQPVGCLAFAPNGWTIASGGDDEAVRIWDVVGWHELCNFSGHTGPVRAVAYSPDGRWLIAAGADGTVQRWRAPEADRPAPVRRPPERVKPRAGSAGRAWAWVISLVVAGFLLIRLVAALWGPSRPSTGPVFLPPLAPQWGGGQNFQDPFRDQELPPMGHPDGVSAVAVAADGRTALSGSFDRIVRLWDLDAKQELRRFEGHKAPVLAVALSADGRHALSGGLDQTVRLWDVGTGRELRRFGNFRSGVTAVAFAPDGTRFAAACGFQKVTHTLKNEPGQPPLANMEWRRPRPPDGSVSVWETDTGRRVFTLRGHGDEVTSVAFTPDGQRLVSGSFDKTASLWDLQTGKEIRRFRGHQGEVFGVAVSPDGKRLLTCSGTLGAVPDKMKAADKQDVVKAPKPAPPAAAPDNTVRLWDLDTGAELGSFPGHQNAVLAVAFSPDGTRAVSGSFDMSVRVWQVETGLELRRYFGHNAAVGAVAVTPDGRRALSGGWDKNLRAWRLPP